jgi:type IV secretion system protein VirD4
MTTTAHRSTGNGTFPYIVLVTAGLGLAVDGALYVASRIAGRPTPGSPSALVLAVQGGYRPTMPVLVLSAFLLLLLIAAGASAVMWWKTRPSHGKSSTRARWATRKDLAPLIVGKDPLSRRVGRIGLGQTDPGERWLAAEPLHSVCALGPSGSGKTLSLVIPALREWKGPAVVTSVKTDAVDATEAQRFNVGPVLVYDPTGSTGRVSATWNPLGACRTWADAWQMASWLVDAAAPSGGEQRTSDPFWTSQGRMLLAPILFVAGTGGRTMADVVRWVQLQDVPEVEALLNGQGVAEAGNAFRAVQKMPGNTKGSIYATVISILEVFADPSIVASADGCDIDPSTLLDTNSTLYLVSPVHAQVRLAPLIEALIMSIVREAQNRAQAGRPCDPGLLLLLDEAGNIAPLRHLPAIASTGRGQGIQVLSVWQDLSQLKHRYGLLAGTVLTNHAGLLAFRGIRDLETLNLLSQLLGDADVDRISTTQQAGGGQSTSRSSQRERLAPIDELRQLPVGGGLLIYGSLPPVRVRFRI